MDKSLVTTLLPILIVGIVLAIRMRSIRRPRPLSLKRIWIAPIILLALAVMTAVMLPVDRLTVAYAILACAVGAALGWYRGKTIALFRDPETGRLMQQPSIAGLVVIGLVIAVKVGAKSLFGVDPSQANGELDPAFLRFTDILLGFGLGFLIATQVELTIRAKRLLGDN